MTGELEREIPYKDDKKNGIGKWYYKSGDLNMEAQFKDDKIIQGFKYTRSGNKTKMTNAHFHNLELKY